jgi:hypothetical protein
MKIKPGPNHRQLSSAHRWQQDVVNFARSHGWRVQSNPSPHGGFPQIVLVRSLPNGDRRLVFVRLLQPKERLSASMREWLHGIEAVALMCSHHIAAYAWEPDDWPTVIDVLS